MNVRGDTITITRLLFLHEKQHLVVLAEESNKIGAVLGLLHAGEDHLGACKPRTENRDETGKKERKRS